jgi:hypothetical protein
VIAPSAQARFSTACKQRRRLRVLEHAAAEQQRLARGLAHPARGGGDRGGGAPVSASVFSGVAAASDEAERRGCIGRHGFWDTQVERGAGQAQRQRQLGARAWQPASRP